MPHCLTVMGFSPISRANSAADGNIWMMCFMRYNLDRALPQVNPLCIVLDATFPLMQPHDRLRLARERAGFESGADASRRFGWPEGSYRHHENGTRNFPKHKAIDYARAFKVSPEWLLLGIDGEPGYAVPVFGLVGAGAEIYSNDDGQIDAIEPPPGVSASAIAVIVRGESMFPRYFDGDILIYDEHVTPSKANGSECIVALRDGRRLVKIVRFRQGTVVLESYNAPPIENAQIDWCAPIKWVKRG